jgi:hypothetical protein
MESGTKVIAVRDLSHGKHTIHKGTFGVVADSLDAWRIVFESEKVTEHDGIVSGSVYFVPFDGEHLPDGIALIDDIPHTNARWENMR